ncbi:MAG TPA: fluoride efflux transporter CrcB [Burkholderiales bacterium]|nr:fluoride efflux transporter CrcB [Burkholderiales bacterium]
MVFSVVSISLGAALGALLRWALSLRFNAVYPALPLGTLLSNVIGGYLIGVAVAFFAQHPTLPPEWRLFAITGFLGGLTTFSTFSAEVVDHLLAGRVAWGIALVATHVASSVAMTLLGVGTVALIRTTLPGG